MSDGFLRPPASAGTPDGPDPSTLTPPGAPAALPASASTPPVEAARPPATANATPPASGAPRPWLWVHTARPNPLETPTATSTAAEPAPGASSPAPSRNAATPGRPETAEARTSFLPARVCHDAPRGLEMTGGTSMQLDGAVTLDRLASGYGALTITWTLTGTGHDLIALADGTPVEPRGDEFVIDLLTGVDRVLICTGTARGVDLPESTIVVANGSTRVECRLPAGTSHGVWPRLSLVGVDEFVVLLDEHDPGSGDLGPVAAAYGHDAASFVRAGH